MFRIKQSVVCTHSVTRVGCRLHRLLHPFRIPNTDTYIRTRMRCSCDVPLISRRLIHRRIYPDIDNDLVNLSSFFSQTGSIVRTCLGKHGLKIRGTQRTCTCGNRIYKVNRGRCSKNSEFTVRRIIRII